MADLDDLLAFLENDNVTNSVKKNIQEHEESADEEEDSSETPENLNYFQDSVVEERNEQESGFMLSVLNLLMMMLMIVNYGHHVCISRWRPHGSILLW